MPKIYLLVGVPGSGKTWVAEQCKSKFTVVQHDDYIAKDIKPYLKAIHAAVLASDKPVLCETPFSMSQILEPLDAAGYEVEPVVIYDHPKAISKQYKAREGKDIPQGHLTRNETYCVRAHNNGYFLGNSTEVLEHLKAV